MARLLVILSTLFLFPVCLPAQTITFVLGEWAPYTGAALPGQGVAVAVVKAASLAAGLTPAFEWAPWKRAEQRVEAAGAFGSFPYLELVERKGKFLFSAPLFSLQFQVAVRRGVRPLGSPITTEAFRGLRVGYQAGTEAIPLALEPVGAHLEATPLLEQSLQKLAAGRLDAVIEDGMVLRAALRASGKGEDLVILEGGWGPVQEMGVMVGVLYPDAALLLRRFDDGLARIKANGTYDRLVAALDGPW